MSQVLLILFGASLGFAGSAVQQRLSHRHAATERRNANERLLLSQIQVALLQMLMSLHAWHRERSQYRADSLAVELPRHLPDEDLPTPEDLMAFSAVAVPVPDFYIAARTELRRLGSQLADKGLQDELERHIELTFTVFGLHNSDDRVFEILIDISTMHHALTARTGDRMRELA